MEKRKVYLDNSATTYTRPEVVDAMLPYYTNIYGNASSVHKFGQDAKNALTEARKKFAQLINAQSPDEIIFTSCGTESDNMAIIGVLEATNGKNIITSQLEHHAVFHTCKYLETCGYKVDYIPVDSSGIIKLDVLKEKITDKTTIISIMHANNEIGVIEPIEEISKIVKELNSIRKNQIFFHTDAVQTAGKIKLDVQKLGIDLLSVSAHKFYGPKGVGVLYVKQGTKISPILHGGYHENGLKPGTENIAGIVGMTKALELANNELESENKKCSMLREKLKNGILKLIPKSIINTDFSNSVSSILNVSFESIEGESLILMLDIQGIAVSTGSACASGETEPSYVLKAIGLDPVTSQGTIRFSLGRQNTQEDIDYVLEVLPKLVEKVRQMSPVWNKR
jgi:cysteine desulfurase